MKHSLLVLLLVSCGDNIDETGQSHGIEDAIAEWLTSNGAVHGKVYVCESGATCLDETGTKEATEEWCWPGSEEKLESLLGVGPAQCHEITISERAWPALVGCAYACPLEGPGCNAHCGCYCP